MLLSSKILLSIGTFGGGCAGILLFFQQWQKNNLGVSSSQALVTSTSETVTAGSQDSSSSIVSQAKTGNCEVIKSLDNLDTMLWDLGIDSESYITISCEDTNKTEATDIKVPNNWTGLFPEKLFIRNTSSTVGKFEIKTETAPLNTGTTNYKITFSGDKFYSPVTGEWKGETQSAGGKTINIISIISPSVSSTDKIYLSLN